MDKQDIINWLELCRSQSHITDVNQLAMFDDLITHISDDTNGEYERMTDIWSKSCRKEEDSYFVKRNLTQLELVELTDAQNKILDVMIQAMSQDNTIRINQSKLYEVFGFKNQETLNRNLKVLIKLHYIVQIPFDKLNTYDQVFNERDGNVYMVNPRLAVKRERSDALYQIYEDLIGKDNANAFNMRVKQQKLYVSNFVMLPSGVTRNHKLRVGTVKPINEPCKKASVPKAQDASKSNNIIALYDTLNQAQGDN